ncbi:hypothetical protein MHU86_1893 [Fragilaria crotonensis]|nr:hypothetical protein MHU86_1893 [Fragilaria crotonensis]
MYAPAMQYVLPCLALDEEEMAPVQTQVITSILQKLGYSSKLPTEIRYGPSELGGLDLMDLRTELGISTIKYMRDSIYSGTEAGKLMLLNLKYSQIESGIARPLLEYPGLGIPYLTPTWITSVRQFLFQHNLTISLTDTIEILLRGSFDKCIMDNDALSRYTTRQRTDINLVRLYLQIITLSDMSHKDGTTACEYHIRGERRPNQSIRIHTWPRQETPTKQQVRLWRRYISSNFLRYSIKDLTRELRRPIKKQWIKSHQDGKTPYAKLTPDAQLNVDVDALATKCHHNKKSKPRRTTDHLPGVQMSISILKTRYYGNVDAHIRYHINGSYLQGYTQARHHWTDAVWNMIDLEAFGKYFKAVSLKHQPAHVEFIHNQLPLGDRLFQRSAVKDENLTRCPQCKTTDEDIPTFFTVRTT